MALHLQFPAIAWHVLGNTFFVHQWAAYTLSFEGVLAQWEIGNFDQIRPAITQPWGGLMAAIR